jgi:hypothetical protein
MQQASPFWRRDADGMPEGQAPLLLWVRSLREGTKWQCDICQATKTEIPFTGNSQSTVEKHVM